MNDTLDPVDFIRPAPTRQTPDDEVGLGELLRVVQRRKWPLLGVIVATMAAAVIGLLAVTPKYAAETLIMIEPGETPHLLSLESVVAGLSGDEESVQSEAHVLGSPALAGRVVRALDLTNDPEFQPSDESLTGEMAFSAVVDKFLDNLDVTPLESSRVISVRFSSTDAEKSARIANAIANEYLQARLETKYELTAQANTWLSHRIGELQDQVAAAEAKVERARGEFGLLETDGVTLSARELSELNSQLVIAKATLAESAARLKQVEGLNRDKLRADTAMEVLNSPLIQRLREQEVGVQRRVAELSSELGRLHPRMIQLRAEEDDIRQRIDAEIAKIVAGLKNQVNVAQARVDALEESLDGLKTSVAKANQNEIELRALEREAEASRTLLSTLLARQKETISQSDQSFQQPDATVVSPAAPPAKPSFPRPAVVLGLALIGSVFLGAVVVMMIELLDGGFRSGEQFEAETGLPSMSLVPEVKLPEEFSSFPGYVAGRPGTLMSESMRNITWSLRLAFPDATPKTVLLTSALTDEGKSIVAACLATSQSMQGQKVLLIDADIRRPSTHTIIGIERDPGLTNVLAKEVALDDALVQSEWSGLTVLPAGSPNPHAPNLLGSAAMKSLLAELSGRFDRIIIDSPPTMVATDARILCQLADATVLVARWGKTRRNVVRLSVRQLNAAGANLAGGVLTMVDIKRQSFYGFGDSSAYGGAMSTYFAN